METKPRRNILERQGVAKTTREVRGEGIYHRITLEMCAKIWSEAAKKGVTFYSVFHCFYLMGVEDPRKTRRPYIEHLLCARHDAKCWEGPGVTCDPALREFAASMHTDNHTKQ